MGAPKAKNAEGAEIAGRCRRVGWDVQIGSSGEPWDFKITPPKPHAPIYIHKTPSSNRWKTYLMSELRRAGFDEAEAEADRREVEERAAKLKADEEANNRAAKAAEKRAKEAAAVAAAAGPYGGPQPLDMTWTCTPTELPQTRPSIVTPDQAAWILDNMNTHNRPLREQRWLYLAECILRGEWAMTHQGIAFDTNGVLQDGQHRLRAIMEAGKPVTIQVTVGMPPENFLKVDTGANRSARDAAVMRGETDPGLITSAAKLLLNIDRYGPDAHVKSRRNLISNDMVDRALDAFGEDLHEALRVGKALKRQMKRTNVAAAAAAIYLIRQRLPQGDLRVMKFEDDFEYGENVLRGDPVWHLRKLLFNAGTGRHGYDAWEQMALIIKAWNHRAKGNRSMHLLIWKKGSEVFPHQIFLPPPIEIDTAAMAAA